MPNVFDDATTSDLIAIVRQWRAGKLPIGGSRPSRQLATYQPQLPFFTNDSGETIPPYACMQITGTLDVGDRNYLVVDKPADTDGTAGAFIFNGGREVEADTEGLAQASTVVRGFKDTGTATGGERWSPVSGQWYIEQDDAGQFICCGDDGVDDDVVKVVAVGGGVATKVFLTPGGGIAARSGTALGSATCTIVTVAGGTRTVTAGTDTVYNDFLSSVSASVDVIAIKIDGIWIVQAEDCS